LECVLSRSSQRNRQIDLSFLDSFVEENLMDCEVLLKSALVCLRRSTIYTFDISGLLSYENYVAVDHSDLLLICRMSTVKANL
jgi:hypothetical protein